MNVPLVIAGSLAVVGAMIHGGAGEVLVVKKLSPEMLPSTRLGGRRLTKAMIHVTWHMTTFAFLTVGAMLLLSATALHGDTARGFGVLAGGAATGFAALAVGFGAAQTRSPRSLLRHPGPVLLTVTAALAWWGVL